MCDAVIVDTPPGFTPEVIATIDVSSEICMVGMLDSLSLKNTKLGLETLDLMGYDTEHVSLVLNRADSRVGITPEDVSTIVGRGPDIVGPERPRDPALGQRGNPDRGLEADLRRREGVPGPGRPVREDACPEAGTAPERFQRRRPGADREETLEMELHERLNTSKPVTGAQRSVR